MYRSVISAHEEKHKQLVVENHELRQILTYLLTELSTLTHGCSPTQSCDQRDDEVFVIISSIIVVVVVVVVAGTLLCNSESGFKLIILSCPCSCCLQHVKFGIILLLIIIIIVQRHLKTLLITIRECAVTMFAVASVCLSVSLSLSVYLSVSLSVCL